MTPTTYPLSQNYFAMICFLVFGLTANQAAANSLEDMVGAGGRSKGMGGVGTALSTDLSAVYYNVANLAFGKESTLSIGFSHIGYNFTVDGAPDDPEMEAMRPRDNFSLGLSLLLPFDLSFGVMVNVAPKVPQYFEQGSPDSKPRFIMYGQRLEKISFMLGFAYKIADSLSVGIGTTALVNSALIINNQIPFLVESETMTNQFAWTLQPNMGYYGGIHYRPTEQLYLGLSFRSSLFHKMEAVVESTVYPLSVNVPVDLNILLEVYSWFSPAQIAFGTSYVPTSSLLFSLDLTWYDWSRYPGPFINASDIDGSAEAAGLVFLEYNSPNFKDVVVPRFGVEVKPYKAVALRAGYSYRFSPASAPTKSENILDSNMHIGTLGLGYRWEYEGKAPENGAKRSKSDAFAIDLDLYGSIGVMPTTKVNKTEVQEVLNDFDFGGMVFDFGLLITSGF